MFGKHVANRKSVVQFNSATILLNFDIYFFSLKATNGWCQYCALWVINTIFINNVQSPVMWIRLLGRRNQNESIFFCSKSMRNSYKSTAFKMNFSFFSRSSGKNSRKLNQHWKFSWESNHTERLFSVPNFLASSYPVRQAHTPNATAWPSPLWNMIWPAAAFEHIKFIAWPAATVPSLVTAEWISLFAWTSKNK